MKKIIWVTTVAQSMGLFRGQLNYLSKHFHLTFVSSNGEDETELIVKGEKEGIPVHEIPMSREISLVKDIKSFFYIIWYFQKEKPDTVHGNTPKGGLLSMMAARISGVPTRIYMCHGLRYQGCSGLKKKLLMSMEKLSCSCATHVICVSDGVKETLVANGLCTPKKSLVIGYGSCNGIDTSQFDALAYSQDERQALRTKFGIADDEFIFIYMGRIVKDKGINELVEAFSRYRKEYPKVRLMMLGAFEDELNPVLPNTAALIKNNKQGVVYCGKQSDVKPFLAASQCLVLPSYREGFGMVLMEAGAMGLPVISSDIIGCNNVVNTNENGLLVQPGSVDDLYSKMKMMVENKELYRKFASNTRLSIQRRFEQKKLWEKYLEFYIKIV